MVSARHLLGAAVVVSVAVAVGCASRPRAKSRSAPGPSSAVAAKKAPSASPVASGAPNFEPVAPDAPGGASEVAPHSLAQHTEQYAKNLESLASRRSAGTDDPAKTGGGVDPFTFPGINAASQPAAPSMSFSTIPPANANAQANVGMDVTSGREGAEASRVAPTPPAAPAEVETNTKTQAQAVEPPPAGAQPAAARSPAMSPSTNELLQTLAIKIKDDPRDAVSHLNYQLLQFLLDEQVPDLGSIAPLPAEDRELLTTLLDGLSNFRNGLRAEANSLQSKKVAPLLELADRLRSQGDLTISTAALCRSVQRFGVYEPMDPPRFIAGGKENDAILYCEVANFSSQLNDRKLWETKLKQEATLFSETGLQVWSDKSDTVIDQSRNRLHDFFIADKVRLPSSLPVGRYLMKMTVTDLNANRVAEATVPIQIVAQ